jgi:hypothetical protein
LKRNPTWKGFEGPWSALSSTILQRDLPSIDLLEHCGMISTGGGHTVLRGSTHLEGKNPILQQGNSSRCLSKLRSTIPLDFGWYWGFGERGPKYQGATTRKSAQLSHTGEIQP